MPRKLSNQDIADQLEEISLMLEAEGVAYEPRAYENAAFVVRELDEDLKDLYKTCGKKCIDDLPSIGETMTKHIEEAVTKGKITKYDQLKKKFPFDLPAMVAIEGIGPKKARELYKQLGVKTLEQLKKAAQQGEIAKIKGFSETSQASILEGIGFVKEHKGRFVIHEVYPRAEAVLEMIRNVKGVQEAMASGSLARMKETIGDIDLIVATTDPEAVKEAVKNMPQTRKVFQEGDNKVLVRLKSGIDCDVLAYPPSEFGSVKAYFNSSKQHAIALRTLAHKKGWMLTDTGLYKGKKKVAGASEEQIYKKLGLQYIPPELREWPDILELAKAKKIPSLIGYGDLKGDLQVQSDWTDGAHSIEDMAKAAKAAGLAYIAITDHTKALAMTGGLDERRLKKQGKEIDRLNKKMRGFRILKSTECDILKDGRLDLSDAALKPLDLVAVSVHSNMKMDEAKMTERVIKVFKHPSVNIFFHPTGRKVNRRAPYKLDVSKIIKAAKEYKVALEVNASDRLDLKDTYVREAVEHKVKLVIDSDAHHKDEFAWLKYGIGQARRGFAKKSDILNTKSAAGLLQAMRK